MPEIPATSRRQRVAAYAVILRTGADGEEVLLSRLAPYLTRQERWTLPGGGVEFGEHPRDAVVREVYEETGLEATVGELAWVDSGHRSLVREGVELHAVRMVFEGWVARDAPAPRVVEVDGSTIDARWHRLADVLDETVPTTPMVIEALGGLAPARHQRLAAYALLRRGSGDREEVLLTRISGRGHHVGAWTLPGGGVDHGEAPADALVREVYEETGLRVRPGPLLGVHDVHFSGTAPDGRFEDFHGVHLVFAAESDPSATVPTVTQDDGTTDEVAWTPVRDLREGRVRALEVVHEALTWAP